MMRLSVELRLNLSSRVPALVLRLSVESWHTLRPYRTVCRAMLRRQRNSNSKFLNIRKFIRYTAWAAGRLWALGPGGVEYLERCVESGV